MFEQTNGGFGATDPAYRQLRYPSFKSARLRAAVDIKPFLSKDTKKWTWREVGSWQFLSHDTEEEARQAIARYVDRLREGVTPRCPRCDEWTEDNHTYVKCSACQLMQPKTKRAKDKKFWTSLKDAQIYTEEEIRDNL